MSIRELSKSDYLDLVSVFSEMENYYFGVGAATKPQIEEYLYNRVFSEYSGVKVVGYYLESEIVGFATFSILYPAPKLSGQMFMKDLFVSSRARGNKVGQKLMRYIATIALTRGCVRLDWTAESTNPGAG